ncbi:hypothetical protein MnTg04_00880 [bacterium MnTg04]|nr:hypothetical protein MnTg04_00880 [bacterium MnTg04]
MLCAIARRGPRNGSASPSAGGALGAVLADPGCEAWRTSSAVTWPNLPLAGTEARSSPIFFANARVAGAALIRPRARLRLPPATAVSTTISSLVGMLPTTVPVSPLFSSSASLPGVVSSSPSIWKSARGLPVSTMPPSAACNFTTVPVKGEGTSTTALAVSTESSGSSTLILSPSLTCQVTISASGSPSPRSGNIKVFIAFSWWARRQSKRVAVYSSIVSLQASTILSTQGR